MITEYPAEPRPGIAIQKYDARMAGAWEKSLLFAEDPTGLKLAVEIANRFYEDAHIAYYGNNTWPAGATGFYNARLGDLCRLYDVIPAVARDAIRDYVVMNTEYAYCTSALTIYQDAMNWRFYDRLMEKEMPIAEIQSDPIDISGWGDWK